MNLAVSAKEKLREEGIDVAVVSLSPWDWFEKKPEDYKEQVLPKNVKKRHAIEMVRLSVGIALPEMKGITRPSIVSVLLLRVKLSSVNTALPSKMLSCGSHNY